MAEQFLTLMADLDGETQEIMSGWYEELQKEGFDGEQTHGIPFHISLGSFALDKEAAVVEEMKKLANDFSPIPVHLSHIGMFAGGRILMCAPDMNPGGLLKLHDAIKTENIDCFPWTPHATIIIDDAEIIQKALPTVVRLFRPRLAKVTRLHLCAFWPTREIATIELGIK